MRFNISIFLIIIFTTKIHGFDASLIGNKQVKIFAKCYHQFTRSPLPHDHGYLTNIKNGSKSGAQSCVDFLNEVSLSSNTLAYTSNLEHMSTLKTFNDLHRSWFQIKAFMQ